MKVIVTGCSGALGRSVASTFLDAGSTVFGFHHQAQAAFAHPSLLWERWELADAVSVRTSVGRVLASSASAGRIDALIHCAGGFRYAPVEQMNDADFNYLFEANLKSAFFMAREVLPVMRRQNYGRIVFVGSSSAERPPAGMGAYGAFKTGLITLAHSLTEETRGTGITINSVLPSVLDTLNNRAAMPQANPADWVNTDDLARIIFSMTQKWGDSIRGAALPVTGKMR